MGDPKDRKDVCYIATNGEYAIQRSIALTEIGLIDLALTFDDFTSLSKIFDGWEAEGEFARLRRWAWPLLDLHSLNCKIEMQLWDRTTLATHQVQSQAQLQRDRVEIITTVVHDVQNRLLTVEAKLDRLNIKLDK